MTATDAGRGTFPEAPVEGGEVFPNYCGPMGFVGWLLMLLLWAGVVFLAVCGIARLFPDNRHRTDPAVPSPAAQSEDGPD